MATDDFEEEVYDDDDSSIVDDVQDVKDSYKDLKQSVKDYKKEPSNDAKEAKEFNQQMKNKTAARSSGVDKVGAEASKNAGSQAAKQAGTEAAKNTAANATTQAAAAGSSSAAAGGAAAGGAAAGTAATGAAAAGVSATGVGAIIVAAIALLKAVKKLQDKLDKKAEENGVNLKGIRRLVLASPILAVIFVIILIIVILMLITQTQTIEKTDALQQAIACAESSGCTDFMNTGLTISSASVPYGGLAGTIVAFSGETLSAADEATENSFIAGVNTLFESAMSKKLIYFTDLQIARLVIEYLMFENKYYGMTGSITEMFKDITDDLLKSNNDKERSFIDWLFQLLVDKTIIR